MRLNSEVEMQFREKILWPFLLILGKKYKHLDFSDKVKYWKGVFYLSFLTVVPLTILDFLDFKIPIALFITVLIFIGFAWCIWIFKWRAYVSKRSS